MKYARIDYQTNQMIGGPVDLPARWTTPEGATINFFNKLPDLALAAMGWLPVEYAALPNPETHYHPLAPDYVVDGPKFVYPAVPHDINILRAQAVGAIDQAAGAACARYITIAPGQTERYLIKKDEATRYITAHEAGNSPVDADYPILQAEAAALSEDIVTLAYLVRSTAETWIQLGAAIEGARKGGNKKVTEATTHEVVIIERDATLATLEGI